MNGAHLNPDQLAERARVSDQAIRNIVDDRVSRSRPETMGKLCRALGLDLAAVSAEIGVPADLGPVKLSERTRYLSAANRRLLNLVALAMVDAQPHVGDDDGSAVALSEETVEPGPGPAELRAQS